MDLGKVLACVLLSFFLQAGSSQNLDTDSVLNCCEGDILFLLDSSGSVSSFEFSRMLSFLSELVRPFSLGPEQVGVSLLQVGTEPHLEFGFGTYSTQHGLQEALRRTKQLGGDTNTEGALIFAKQRVLKQDVTGGARPGLPRVLVWLTDGVEPGDVQGPMAELREMGVAVLVVSTGRGNYQVLSDVVSPPAEDHLYFVDIDDMSIITEDLRDAIIRIILAKRLQVRDISSTSAVLHWRPVLTGTGYYDIRFGPVYSGQEGPGGGPGTRPGTGLGHYQRITRPAQSSTAQLTHLRPGTTYNVTLIPESNLEFYNKLSTMFTTHPDEPEPEVVQSPALVTVSESTGNSVRVSWAPLQPDVVQSYRVEYSALPTGKLHVVTTGNLQNSTVLANLLPDTQYLVTVSARHFSGTDKAMSVKVCTQEISPALSDLKLTTMGSDSVQLRWKGSADGLRGYWVTWEGGFAYSQRSTLHLPPHVLSTTLTNVPPNARVCVSPVYKSTRGDGLCCTAHFSSAAVPWSQRL